MRAGNSPDQRAERADDLFPGLNIAFTAPFQEFFIILFLGFPALADQFMILS